jgi:PAS domain S-box-containing protein
VEPRPTGSPRPRLFFRLPLVPVRLLRARHRINDYLHQHGVAEDVIDDVVLAVDEAMTNAVRHSGARDNLQVSLWFEDRDLRVLVRDDGHGFPVESFDPERTPEPLATGGRGLFLIAQVADELELVTDPGLEVRMLMRNALPDHAAMPQIDTGLVDVQLLEGTHYRERRLRLIIDELGEAYAALDWEYRFTYANPAAFDLFGLGPDEILGRPVFELFPSLADGSLGAAIREAVELGHSAIIEFGSEALGGWVECRIYPTGSGVSLYLRDIDARRRRESERDVFLNALVASEERFRTLFESMTEGVALHEVVYRDGRPVDYRILDVNPAFERHTGLNAEAVTGVLASEAYGAGEAPYLDEYIRVTETGEALAFETRAFASASAMSSCARSGAVKRASRRSSRSHRSPWPSPACLRARSCA